MSGNEQQKSFSYRYNNEQLSLHSLLYNQQPSAFDYQECQRKRKSRFILFVYDKKEGLARKVLQRMLKKV